MWRSICWFIGVDIVQLIKSLDREKWEFNWTNLTLWARFRDLFLQHFSSPRDRFHRTIDRDGEEEEVKSRLKKFHPRRSVKNDIIIRWKEIEKEFSFTGFYFSITRRCLASLSHPSFVKNLKRDVFAPVVEIKSQLWNQVSGRQLNTRFLMKFSQNHESVAYQWECCLGNEKKVFLIFMVNLLRRNLRSTPWEIINVGTLTDIFTTSQHALIVVVVCINHLINIFTQLLFAQLTAYFFIFSQLPSAVL